MFTNGFYILYILWVVHRNNKWIWPEIATTTARMGRLIWGFAGRTYQIVGNLTSRLNLFYSNSLRLFVIGFLSAQSTFLCHDTKQTCNKPYWIHCRILQTLNRMKCLRYYQIDLYLIYFLSGFKKLGDSSSNNFSEALKQEESTNECRTKHPRANYPISFFDTLDKTSHKDLPAQTKHPMPFQPPLTKHPMPFLPPRT